MWLVGFNRRASTVRECLAFGDVQAGEAVYICAERVNSNKAWCTSMMCKCSVVPDPAVHNVAALLVTIDSPLEIEPLGNLIALHYGHVHDSGVSIRGNVYALDWSEWHESRHAIMCADMPGVAFELRARRRRPPPSAGSTGGLGGIGGGGGAGVGAAAAPPGGGTEGGGGGCGAGSVGEGGGGDVHAVGGPPGASDGLSEALAHMMDEDLASLADIDAERIAMSAALGIVGGEGEGEAGGQEADPEITDLDVFESKIIGAAAKHTPLTPAELEKFVDATCRGPGWHISPEDALIDAAIELSKGAVIPGGSEVTRARGQEE